MTITINPARNEYTATPAQTVFNYTFKIFANTDLNVYITPAGQAANDSVDLTTAYTVDAGTIGNEAGGFITMDVGVTSGDLVTIVSDVPESRTTDYQFNGDFIPNTVNDDFDRVVQITKQIEDVASRTLSFEEAQQNASGLTLPAPLPGAYLTWNLAGDGVANAGAPAVVIEPITYGNVAAMVAASDIDAGDVVRTTGYTASGDGGDNIYLARAVTGGVDDGGSLIKSAGDLTIEFVGLFYGGMIKDAQFGVLASGGDVSANLASAIAYSVLKKDTLHMIAQTITINSSVSFPTGANIKGVKKDQYPDGFGVDPLGTRINFEPAAPLPFIVADGADISGFRFHNSIEGISIFGNANATIGLDLNGNIYGSYKNVTIKGFDVGVSCSATISNSFEQVHITECRVSCVDYEGSNETTDIWSECTFFGTPTGHRFQGSSISVRFVNCIFEQLNDGAIIARECQSITYVDCYSEDIVFDNTATGAMFKVGLTGVTLAIQNNLIITGGTYSGRNAGVQGSFISSDFCNGIIADGVNRSRFVTGVLTTANTRDDSIIVTGMNGISVTTQFSDLTKIVGLYPHSNIGTAGAETRLRVPVAKVQEIIQDTTASGVIIARGGEKVGFYGTPATVKLAVTGSKGGNAALTSLLTQLATLGLITDNST